MPVAPDLAGRALDGRYELHAVIGEGAFGRVYRGIDRRLARPVAVKVIKPWWAEDSDWVERFQREAQLLASVTDPGIVQIFDIGDADEGPYYVAELIDGESLAERLSAGALAPAQARAIAEQLCRALGSAHAQGVVHCDVKPANVLLASDGGVKVGDFGVARLADATSQAPSATIAGTPRYMAPEQARGLPATPATDVYSAGVVLYEMLAGEPPFATGSPVELGLRHVGERPQSLPAQVPRDLRRIAEKALEKEPRRRYRDGLAMASALAEVDLDPDSPGITGPRRTPLEDEGTGVTEVLADPPTIDLAAALTQPARATGAAAAGANGDGGAAPAHPPADGPGRLPPPTRAPSPRHRRRRWIAAAALLALAAGALALVLLLSGGTGHTTVPDLRGLPRGGVEARARRLHVRPVFTERHSEAPAGVAIAQSPSPGKRVADGTSVAVVLSAGPPPVKVPGVVGEQATAAESAIAGAGLRYHTILVAAPGKAVGSVTRQSPAGGATVPRGRTVDLSVVEAPHWRALTTFSGTGAGNSVPFSILGERWRVSYRMSYQGTCLLLLVCMGPSAQARDVGGGAGFGSFELDEGGPHTHVFEQGRGTYRVEVTAGQDQARWSMTVEDYY